MFIKNHFVYLLCLCCLIKYWFKKMPMQIFRLCAENQSPTEHAHIVFI